MNYLNLSLPCHHRQYCSHAGYLARFVNHFHQPFYDALINIVAPLKILRLFYHPLVVGETIQYRFLLCSIGIEKATKVPHIFEIQL
jgi:hypothetical protein